MTALNLAEGSIKSSWKVFLGQNREFLLGISDEATNLQIPEKIIIIINAHIFIASDAYLC